MPQSQGIQALAFHETLKGKIPTNPNKSQLSHRMEEPHKGIQALAFHPISQGRLC